jgi:zinc/manganese transport system substrate-binding protein
MRTILIMIVVLALTGCGASAGGPGVKVVAAESPWGDVTRQLADDHAQVRSILTSPTADPHLFEAGTKNGLAVAQADVVVQNGLGYDAFMDKLEAASPSRSRLVVTAADEAPGETNPHLWYDVALLPKVAAAIDTALADADPEHTDDYNAALKRFDASLARLRRAIAAIKAQHAGAPVAYTEQVPGYLVEAAGLRNLAPAGFTRAIEDGTEPSPSDVSAMLALISNRRIKVLLYNEQAVSPITSRVRDAARRAGIPVVGVTETLPAGTTFQSWQLGQVKALERALG